jgi:hypothetical protein
LTAPGQTAAPTPELHATPAPQPLTVTSPLPAVPVLVDTEVDSAVPARAVGAADASTPAAGEPRPTPLPSTVAAGEHPLLANGGGAHDSQPAADLRNPAANRNESPPPDEAAPLREGDANTAPRQSGPLADVLSVDAAGLQAGIRSFLGRLDRLGAALTASLSGIPLYCWLLAASAAGAAAVIVRRHAKRPPAHPAADPLFPWTPEADPTPAEDPL